MEANKKIDITVVVVETGLVPVRKRQRIIARATDNHEAKPNGHPQGDVPTRK